MSTELGNIDPAVKIPAAVLAAAARAEEIMKQNGIVQPEPVNEEPLEIEKVISTEPAPQPVNETLTPQPVEKIEKTEKTETLSDWENRYKAMKGRYDRQAEQLASMSSTIAELQRTIADLHDRQDTPARERLLTEEQEQEYGAEFLDVVAKKAKEELSPEVAELKKKLSKMEERFEKVTETQVIDARTKMFNTLDERLPQWTQLNNNEEFLDWLRLPDTYSGAIRHELLKAAYEKNDTSRVLAFFNGFLAEEAAVAPVNAGREFSDAADAPSDKLPLEEFAAPGRAKTAAAAAPTEKPVFTRAQISQFYAAVTANKFRGREAEKDRIEAQIFDAQREGRIR